MTIPNRVKMMAISATGLVALAAVACGSSDTPAARSPSPVPPAQVAATASPAPATPPESTATEPTKPASVGAVARYSWDISAIDDNGAKPSLALAPDGTPHIAFLLEAEPGFVKHTVLNGGDWEISTIDTGYFYGPLDVQVDSKGLPHIAWHSHDTEDAAYATLVGGE